MAVDFTRASATGPVAGDLIGGRYRVVEVLEPPNLWGAVFLAAVSDPTTGSTLERVVRQMRIPPLRQGLAERMEALNAAVRAWQQTPDPSRVSILDSFESDGSMWVVFERVQA